MPSLALSYRPTITILNMRAHPEQCLLTLMKDSATVLSTNKKPKLMYLTRRLHEHSACKWFFFVPSNVSCRHTKTNWNMRAPPEQCLLPLIEDSAKSARYHASQKDMPLSGHSTESSLPQHFNLTIWPFALPYSFYHSFSTLRFRLMLPHTVFTMVSAHPHSKS